MFKRFKWLVCLLLSVVTCGIYQLFFWYQLAKQHNEMAEQIGEKKIMGFIGAFLLGCITCGIFPLIWYFQFMKQEKALAEAKGVALAPTDNVFVLWLICFVPIYSFYAICDNHNKLADAFEA